MATLLWIAGPVAAAIHVLIFAMESLWWNRPWVRRRFGIREESSETTRLFAFNQGFYNLFLAIGLAAGLALLATDHRAAGLALTGFAAASMCGAAAVLVASAPRLWRGAVLQGVPAALALLGLVLA